MTYSDSEQLTQAASSDGRTVSYTYAADGSLTT